MNILNYIYANGSQSQELSEQQESGSSDFAYDELTVMRQLTAVDSQDASLTVATTADVDEPSVFATPRVLAAMVTMH